MPDVRLRIIPKPDEGARSVIQGEAKPFIKGTGQTNCLCGKCGEVLLEAIKPGQVKNVVFRCPTCGSYNELTNSQSEDQQIPAIKSSDTSYSIIARNRTPTINPGEILEIELFLSGYGIPEKNKLHVQWSSPYVVNAKDPGYIEEWITAEPNGSKGRINIRGSSEPRRIPLNETGATIRLQRYLFAEVQTVPEYGFANVAAEGKWEVEGIPEAVPPFLFLINSDKKAQPGDYEVSFTFTYGKYQDLLQDHRLVQFHVTSRLERLQWLLYLGVIIAFLSLVLSAIGAIVDFFSQ